MSAEEGVPLYWQVRNREAMQAQRTAAAAQQRPAVGERTAATAQQRPAVGERTAVAANEPAVVVDAPALTASAAAAAAVRLTSNEPVLVEDTVYDSTACIDLTDDSSASAPVHVIDLTSPVAHPDVVHEAQAPSQAVRQRVGGRKRFRPDAQLVESDEEVEFVAATQPKRTTAESDSGSAKIQRDVMTDVRQQPTPAAEVAPKIVGSIISCPICLDEAQQIRSEGRNLCSTVCGHVFCDECIKNYFKSSKFCPTCRRKLTLKGIHPLFL